MVDSYNIYGATNNCCTIFFDVLYSIWIVNLYYKHASLLYVGGVVLNIREKECKECGKIFKPRCGTQLYCDGPHIAICEFCGKSFEYTCSPKEKPRYCSKQCINEGKKITVRQKYGVDNVSELESVRAKISERNSSPEVDAKRRQTCLKRYGVDNPAKNKDIRKQLSEIMSSENYLKGRETTCLKRYGYASPMQSDDVKQHRAENNLEKYGQVAPGWTADRMKGRMTDSSKLDEYLSFKQDPYAYITTHYSQDNLPGIGTLKADLGVTETPIYDILIAHDCEDLMKRSHSSMEDEIYEYLCSITSTMILRRDRTVIAPKELDLYLPDFHLGIECNPASTHNSSISDPWGGPPTYYKYHKNKSAKAKENDVFLFHIFGYEWNLHKDIIKSMLSNLIHANTCSIGARSTYVCEISDSESRQFLDMNHRQGYTVAKVRLGLRLKSTDELVSVMTFGKMRNTMGKTVDCSTNTWELSRFCNKLFTNVSGGASKLLFYFKKVYVPDKIVSFSDIAHTSGRLYKILGFHKVTESSPSYVWCNVYDTKCFNRVSCQKKNLVKLLNDDSIDIENQTEKEIMESHGYVKVYDCGTIRWEL